VRSRMTLLAILTVGFFLGMRHATDVDHVLAVSTFVGREKSMRSAALVGALWGVGHTLTILVVGGAIVLFGVVLPARVGLAMELCVAVMLVSLGVINLVGSRRGRQAQDRSHPHPHLPRGPLDRLGKLRALRSFAVGVVHGLAGSAAVALLVLATIRQPFAAVLYLLVFGVGTVVGMMLITSAIAAPIVYSGRQLSGWDRHLGWVTGLLSLGFGLALVYQIGFVDGLFGHAPRWTPQ
jgi:high-affinity nickel permease